VANDDASEMSNERQKPKIKKLRNRTLLSNFGKAEDEKRDRNGTELDFLV
jgi:hypothetical protein